MGCGSSKEKVRELHRPLPDNPTATRIFTWEDIRRKSPMYIDLGLQTDISKCQALFAIKYNEDPSGAIEEVVVNGNAICIPQTAANALRVIFENPDIFMALTNRWTPWFWMDCVSINLMDAIEKERQKKLEPFFHAVAKWTLDCTGPVAQIRLGTNAYQSVVSPFVATPVQDTIDNLNRMRGHEAGRVIWTASS